MCLNLEGYGATKFNAILTFWREWILKSPVARSKSGSEEHLALLDKLAKMTRNFWESALSKRNPSFPKGKENKSKILKIKN